MITRSITHCFVILQLCTSVLLQRDRGPPDVSPTERQFRVVYEWRTLDFGFRNEQERSAAIFRGEYVPRNVIISDVKPYANRLYLVIKFFISLSSKRDFVKNKILSSSQHSQSHECCPVHLPLWVTSLHQTTTAERIPKLCLIPTGK